MNNNNQNQFSYDPYWTEEQIKRELENGNLIQGKIRINQRNFEDAFLSDMVKFRKNTQVLLLHLQINFLILEWRRRYLYRRRQGSQSFS